MTANEKALLLHEEQRGKLETTSKAKIASREDLALAYAPGIVEPYRVIVVDPEAAYRYTIKSNTIAIVFNGSAVLGLGNIGPLTTMPIMEGKAVLFKEFGGANAFPICLDTQDTQEVTETVVRIAPAFGGISLEDTSAPRCLETEGVLRGRLDIPVFHDDQHGTATMVLTGVINALRLTGKEKEGCRVVINNAGSAGIAITKLLLTYGFSHVTICNKSGILSKGTEGPNRMQEKMVDVTNLERKIGTLTDATKGVDVFVDVSTPGIVTQDMVASMNKDTILFTMANPVPEVMLGLARAAGAHVVGAGRSNFPNQVNNVVVFPRVFKGVLEDRVSAVTGEMKLTAAEAIAGPVGEKNLSDEDILPEAFDLHVADIASSAVRDHTGK